MLRDNSPPLETTHPRRQPPTENTPGDNPPSRLGVLTLTDPHGILTLILTNPNPPMGRQIIWKLTLTHIPDPKTNQYTRVGGLSPGRGSCLQGGLSPVTDFTTVMRLLRRDASSSATAAAPAHLSIKLTTTCVQESASFWNYLIRNLRGSYNVMANG